MTISGTTTFRSDLIRSSVVDDRRGVLQQGPVQHQLRPWHGHGRLPADRRSRGRSTATELAIGLNFGGDPASPCQPTPVEPLPSIPPTLPEPADRRLRPGRRSTGCPRSRSSTSTARTGSACRTCRPGPRYAVADPARYVDPTTGTVLVRYVNDRQDGVGFSVDIVDQGTVR